MSRCTRGWSGRGPSSGRSSRRARRGRAPCARRR
jgi:hypothetical protein